MCKLLVITCLLWVVFCMALCSWYQMEACRLQGKIQSKTESKQAIVSQCIIVPNLFALPFIQRFSGCLHLHGKLLSCLGHLVVQASGWSLLHTTVSALAGRYSLLWWQIKMLPCWYLNSNWLRCSVLNLSAG